MLEIKSIKCNSIQSIEHNSCISLAFSLCTGLVKKLLNATRNKKKKHDKIVCYVSWKQNKQYRKQNI